MRPRNPFLASTRHAVIVVLAVLPACKSSDSGAPEVCTVNGINIVPLTVDLVVGGERLLVASVGYTNCASAPPVTWETGAPAVAVVTADGATAEVLAIGPGVAIITATATGASNVVQASATVNVAEEPVAQVTIAAPLTTIMVGQVVTLTAEPRSASGAILEGRLVTWTTSNPSAVWVDPTGRIEGVGLGQSLITATSEGKSASVLITVVPVAVATVTVTPGEATLQTGQNLPLEATARDANGDIINGRVFEWMSTTQDVASVTAQGLVEALAPGTTTIRATTDGVFGEAAVTVNSAGDAARFAWASIETVGAASNVIRWHNGKGGAVTSVRQSTGQFRVTFPGLGDPFGARTETSEGVIVSAYRTALRQCGINDWFDAGSDLIVEVVCTDVTTALADADFNILVVGRASLANPSSFLRATSLAADYVPDIRWSWNSGELPMRITQQTSSRTLDLGIANGSAAGYLATPTLASTAGVCALFGIPDDSPAASVRCFAPNGLVQDRLFTVLMLRGGHVLKPAGRYGFARVTSPGPGQTQIGAPLGGSSSGGAIVATWLEPGRWRVRFGGLAAPGGGIAEVALITPLEQPYAACHVESWGPSGADLDVFVRCHGAAGAAQDHRFSVVVIE